MILRDSCDSWAGIRAHRAAGEPLCGACRMRALLVESMPSLPAPLATTQRADVMLPPITPEMAKENRRILAEALGAEDDVLQVRRDAA